MTTFDLKKLIKVDESWLSPQGLELAYIVDDKEKFFEFRPLRTCEILQRAGLIEDYKLYQVGNRLIVSFELPIDDDNSILTEMNFEDFTASFRFSQYDAICIAAMLEQDERQDEEVSKILAFHYYRGQAV